MFGSEVGDLMPFLELKECGRELGMEFSRWDYGYY